MPTLSFDIRDNLDRLTRLTEHIKDLQRQLASIDTTRPNSAVRSLELELAQATREQKLLIESSAKAAHMLETDFRKGADTAARSVRGLFDALQSPIGSVASIAGIGALGGFLNNIQRTRGQFQLMETNIQTLLGSAVKGKAMMAQLNDYAKVSPLDFQGSVNAAQQMLGFGIDEQKVIPFMKALGDVSMGDANRFKSLTLAFSQMSAAGKLMGQDLMQMVNAGFQPLDQLAKDTGKSIGDLKEEMSKGKISAEMVQQAFINATSAGGKYYNMSNAATSTIDGQMSMLEDATTLMFNDLGEKSQGVIIQLIKGATALVENYDKVAVALAAVGAGFAAFRLEKMAEQKQTLDAMTDAANRLAEARRNVGEVKFDEQVQQALDKERITLEEAVEWQNTLNALKAEGADGKTLDQLKKEAEARIAASEAARQEADAIWERINAANGVNPGDSTATPDLSGLDTDIADKVKDKLISEEEASRLQEARDTLAQMGAEADDLVLTTQAEVTETAEFLSQQEESLRAAEERNEKAQRFLELAEERAELVQSLYDDNYLTQDEEDRLDAINAEIGALGDKEIAEEAAAAAQELATRQEELNTAQELANEAATAAGAATDRSATLSTAANTTATGANTAATGTNTAAQAKNTIGMRLHTMTQNIATVSTRMYNTAVQQVRASWEALKVSMMTNPLGFIIGAVGLLASGLWALKDAFWGADEVAEEAGESYLEEKANIDALYASMQAFGKETKVHQDARQELIRIMKEHGIQVDAEKVTLEELIALHSQLTEILEEERKQKILNDAIESYKNDVAEAEEQLNKALMSTVKGQTGKYASQYVAVIKVAMENNREILRAMNEEWAKGIARDAGKIMELRAQLQQNINSELAGFNEKLGMDFQLELPPYVGALGKWSRGMMDYVDSTDKATEANNALVESQKKVSENEVKPYSAEGRDSKDLLKDITEATEAIDNADTAIKKADEDLKKLGEAEVKPEVDKSSVEEAKETTEGANETIDQTGEKEVEPTVDKSQMDDLSESADTAKGKVEEVDATSATPTVDDSLWRGFLDTLREVWDFITKIFKAGGKDLPQSPAPATPTPSQQATEPKQKATDSKNEAEKKKKDAIAEVKKSIDNAKDQATIDAIVKNTKEKIGGMSVDDKDLKTMQDIYNKATKKQEKIKKELGLDKKKGGKDDPKQRAYNVAKLEEQERLRVEAEALKERQRLRDLETAMMEESYAKQMKLAEDKRLTLTENLDATLAKEIRAAKERDRKLWKSGGKDRKDYQWTQAKTDAEYEEEVRAIMGYATQKAKIEHDAAEAIRKINEKSEEAAREYLRQFGDRIQKRKALIDEYTEKIRKAEYEGEKARLRAELRQKTSEADTASYDRMLAQYGTYQERRLALAREYERKIRDEAATEADEATLRREWAQKESDLNLSEQMTLKGIEPLMNVLSDLSTDALGRLEEELQRLMQMSGLTAEQFADLSAKLTEVRNASSSRQTWFESINPFSRRNLNPNAQRIDEANARKDAALGRKERAEQRGMEQTFQMNLQRNRLSQLTGLDKEEITSERLTEIETQFGDNSEVRDSLTQFVKAMGGAAEASEEAAAASAEATAAGAEAAGLGAAAGPMMTDAIIHGINDNIQSALNLVGQLGLEDTGFGQAFADFAESSQYATQAFDSLKNGDFFGVVSNLYGAFGSLGDFLGRLGIGGMGASDVNLHKDMERLARSNDALQQAITALSRDLKDSSTYEALGVYKEQREYLQRAQKDQQRIMQRAGASHNSGFLGIGAKSSSNKKIDKALSASDWALVSSITGQAVSNASEFWSLSSKQMADVAKNAPQVWAEIKKAASDGYDDVGQYLDEYITYWEQLEELADAFHEKVTGTTFDSVAGDFQSMLADMDSTATDFTQDFEQKMRNAVINSLMDTYFNERLKEWYEKFGEYMGNDGKLDTRELEELRSDYRNITEEGLERRDAALEALGLDESSTQQTSRRSLQGMTQDTADAIEGRMTALQIAVEAIRAFETTDTENIALMTRQQWEILTVQKAASQTLSGIEEQLAKSYLELQSINENTGAIVSPIRQMQTDLNDIRNKIKNL